MKGRLESNDFEHVEGGALSIRPEYFTFFVTNNAVPFTNDLHSDSQPT